MVSTLPQLHLVWDGTNIQIQVLIVLKLVQALKRKELEDIYTSSLICFSAKYVL